MIDDAAPQQHGRKRLHERFFGHQRVTVIEAARGWRLSDLSELFAYRELLWVLTVRDLKVRYKQTAVGAAWAVLQPVATMAIFSLVFGRLLDVESEGYPYPIFVFAALLPWTFFANSLSSCGVSLVNSAPLVTKVYFPRILVPAAAVASGLVDLAVASSVLLALMLYYGVAWSLHLLAVPILLLGLVLVTLGIGCWLAAVTVTYRDFRFVIPFLVQIWMFATPVIYPSSVVPESWQWMLWLNPLSGLINAFRSAFLGKPFDLSTFAISMAFSILVFIFGFAYFTRVERRFADVI